MSKNEHIVIGPGLKCLCGMYDNKIVGCSDIIAALNLLEHRLPEIETSENIVEHVHGDTSQIAVIIPVLRSYVQDVDAPVSVSIEVNGTRHQWMKRFITYEEVMTMIGQDPTRIYSMTYFRGEAPKSEGTLTPGRSAAVKTGMHITAMDTSNA